jgi:hypothetical protein
LGETALRDRVLAQGGKDVQEMKDEQEIKTRCPRAAEEREPPA